MAITYRNWRNEVKTWTPESGLQNYFLHVDKAPTAKDGNGYLSLAMGGMADAYSHSIEETRELASALMSKYSDFDWSNSNPCIVQAPCAFDIRHSSILIEEVK